MLNIIICIIAGLGAGLGTGFAGMSAAAVISPMLITFLHMDPYMAVGIALQRICLTIFFTDYISFKITRKPNVICSCHLKPI